MMKKKVKRKCFSASFRKILRWMVTSTFLSWYKWSTVLSKLCTYGMRPWTTSCAWLDSKYRTLTHALYIKVMNGHCVLLLVYLDDALVADSSLDLIARTESNLKTRFKVTNSCKCTFMLGIDLVDEAIGSVTMCQQRYFNDILKRFGMDKVQEHCHSGRFELSTSPSRNAT